MTDAGKHSIFAFDYFYRCKILHFCVLKQAPYQLLNHTEHEQSTRRISDIEKDPTSINFVNRAHLGVELGLINSKYNKKSANRPYAITVLQRK